MSVPLRAVTSALDADVLTALAGTTTPLTGRRVAALSARGSRAGVQRVLDRLERQGLVHATNAGAARVYVLNREHLLAPVVEYASRVLHDLVDRLREEIDRWTLPCQHASLFGSVARGDGGVDSDIDLLVVRSDGLGADDERWVRQLSHVEERVIRWTGNPVAWFDVSVSDLRRARDRGEPIVDSWRDEAVHLTGRPLGRLLQAEAGP